MSNLYISNSDDVIDSRDIISRIGELESDLEALQEAVKDAESEANDYTNCEQEVAREALQTAQEEFETWSDAEELRILKALQEEAEDCAGDWHYGATLIRDSYFTEYAQQLAEDIGEISRSCHWPNTCIDWEQAANELKNDYSCIDFDGVEYWVRS